MSSDTTNSRGKQVGLIALVVGIVGIVIALFGFKQGWDTGEVRPIMSWLIALGFGYQLRLVCSFSCRSGMFSMLAGRRLFVVSASISWQPFLICSFFFCRC